MFAYVTKACRRLFLGPTTAPIRLCFPVSNAVYDGIRALSAEERHQVIKLLGFAVEDALRLWVLGAPKDGGEAPATPVPEPQRLSLATPHDRWRLELPLEASLYEALVALGPTRDDEVVARVQDAVGQIVAALREPTPMPWSEEGEP